jgi:hypothetical protein
MYAFIDGHYELLIDLAKKVVRGGPIGALIPTIAPMIKRLNVRV